MGQIRETKQPRRTMLSRIEANIEAVEDSGEAAVQATCRSIAEQVPPFGSVCGRHTTDGADELRVESERAERFIALGIEEPDQNAFAGRSIRRECAAPISARCEMGSTWFA